jgi:hypothetical protein
MAQCLTYYVRVDEHGAPIGGTQQGFAPSNWSSGSEFTTNALPCDAGCNYVQLPATQMTVPAGKTRCLFPSGIRYFYQVNRKSGQVKPNSIRQGYEFPQDLNSCLWREFIKWC